MTDQSGAFPWVLMGDVVDFVFRGISYSKSVLTTDSDATPMVNLANIGKGGGFRDDGFKYYSGPSKKNVTLIPGDLVIANTDLSSAKDVLGAPVVIPSSVAGREVVFTHHITKLIPDETKILKLYLKYFLESPIARQFMKAHGSGTTVMNLQTRALPKMEVPLPSLEDQRRIVEQLDVQLYKLEKSRESLVKLKLLLKSLSRSLLHHNVSGHGDLYSLSELCTLITDGSHFSPKTVERGFPYITVRDLQDSGIDFENCKYINEDSFLELERSGCSPKPGDVLFSKDGTVGKVALVSSTEPFVVLSSLAILRPNSSLITPEFLKLSLRSPEVLEQALGMKSGTAIRRVVLRTLKTLEIAVPSLDEQRSIVKFVDGELSRLGSLDNQIEELIDQHENLRRSLLHAAFAGQLTKEN